MAYQFPLEGGRINASVGGNSTSAGAGYSLVSTGTLLLAGGNNITLSQNGSAITISGANAPAASINFSASNTSASLASVTFSNSNGVSFGLNAGVITASHNGITSQSAQTGNLYVSSNSTQLSSTAGVDLRSLSFQGAGGASIGVSQGKVLVSVNSTYAASNHSHGNPTLNLTNISGTTASASNGLTLSLSAAAQSVQTQSVIQGVIASGSTNRTGDISFANSNGVTFGLSNNTVTASVAAGGGGVALYDGVNSISSGTARISAAGALTASVNGQTLSLSAPAVSSLSATGAVSISNNAGTISIGAPAFSAGVASNSTVTNQLILTGGNNITLSQSTNATGATVSISAANQTAQTQSNIQGIIASGSTNYTGNISFANSNGVTFGLSNNTVTASVAAGGGGGIALANSQTSFTSGTVNLLEGGGAITIASTTGQKYNFSVPATSSLSVTGALSISRNGSTVSIGAPAFSVGMSTIGNTSGTTGTVSNQLILAGGNNITLSQSTGVGGNTISIIGGAGGGGGGGVALSANALISSGTASLSAAGALTASVNGQTLSLSVPAQSSISVTGALSMSNNGSTISLGAPGTSSLIGINGVSISTTSNSIYLSGPTPTLQRWEHPTAVFSTLPAIVNNSLSLQHMYVPFFVTGTEMKIGGSLSVGTHTSASTGSVTISYKMALYTLNGSTLSLATSGGGSTAFGVSSNSTSSIAGMRQFTAQMNINMTPGQYWAAAMMSTTTNYASNSMTFTLYGNNQVPTAASNAILSPMGVAVTAAPRDVYLFQGVYATTTTAFPTAIQGSQINNSSASAAMRAQFYNAIYNATY